MASVKTAKIVDPRIEPQPEPVYAVTVGPKQNQFYKIPASGLSDSYITFNNLTTLGADRAYLDTFELEITATISFDTAAIASDKDPGAPNPEMWTFDSWPFNKCCDQVRVNINGGAFFSQPMTYIRAKERYWDELKINDSYANVCPCHKPLLQSELGVDPDLHSSGQGDLDQAIATAIEQRKGCAGVPTRLGYNTGLMRTAAGTFSSCNNTACVNPYTCVKDGSVVNITATWREPIFASPFSSRIDATWGRPLYNITSMDIAFNMQNLKNMIRMCDYKGVDTWNITLTSVQLCYQVETIPATMKPPKMTVVPYRRIVPYVTDYPNVIEGVPRPGRLIEMTSGVYTLNEVPTAIWVFAAPTKAELDSGLCDGLIVPNGNANNLTWGFNKLFHPIRQISISCGNTTQILETASVYDLYRIAKANGCKDDFGTWVKFKPFQSRNVALRFDESNIPSVYDVEPAYLSGPVGSVLRLIPGVDIVLPEEDLIPGSNANNMVFQVKLTIEPQPLPANYNHISLWLLFEYVGVAVITPGQCSITMNPLGDGKPMQSAPIVSATPTEEASPATMEGSGWFDKIKNALSTANAIAKKTGIVSNLLSNVPGVGETLSSIAKSAGYGRIRPGGKLRREDIEGGAVMGLGDFC